MNQRYLNIIRHYKKYKAENPDTWIEYSAEQQNLTDAIEKAALCINEEGKKHPHQYRLRRSTLQAFAEVLKERVTEIEHCNSFAELIQTVRSHKIPGIGELTAYDIAVRIGAYIDVWPEEIYLHAGAKVGAAHLVGQLPADVISKDILPDEFKESDLSCYELEDVMCIYKRVFERRKN